MQLGFYFDQTRCTGCYTCLIACKDWHEYELGIEPRDWISVNVIEKGLFPEMSMNYLFLTCFHCVNPACMEICNADAISKREEDGIVIVDRNVCVGCGECGPVCPYDIPKFGIDQETEMEKCDLCLERWQTGKKPICVEACPMRALDAGPLDELRAKYGGIKKAAGFVYSNELGPSICFKPGGK